MLCCRVLAEEGCEAAYLVGESRSDVLRTVL